MVLDAEGIAPSELSVTSRAINFSASSFPGVEFRLPATGDAFGLIRLVNAGAFRIEFDDGTVWDQATIDAKLAAPPPAQDDAPAVFPSTDEADVIYGTSAGGSFVSSRGDDLLVGDSGNDRYRYGQGDGFDVIEDRGGTDALEFAAGITPADVGIFSQGNDFVLTAGSGGVRIRGGRTPEGASSGWNFRTPPCGPRPTSQRARRCCRTTGHRRCPLRLAASPSIPVRQSRSRSRRTPSQILIVSTRSVISPLRRMATRCPTGWHSTLHRLLFRVRQLPATSAQMKSCSSRQMQMARRRSVASALRSAQARWLPIPESLRLHRQKRFPARRRRHPCINARAHGYGTE